MEILLWISIFGIPAVAFLLVWSSLKGDKPAAEPGPAAGARAPLASPGVLPGEEVREAIQRACRATGRVKPEAARWLAKVVLDAGGTLEDITRRALGTGKRLSKTEKRALGVPVGMPLSQRCWDSLTEQGQADPGAAIYGVLQRALAGLNREQDLLEFRRMGVQRIGIAPAESGCCRAVAALADQTFALDNPPPLPLADCDAAECRCDYALLPEDRAKAE